ncbi:MAG: PVC-type heme-binding CxxCH protein [Planctomycetaceae bacterium]
MRSMGKPFAGVVCLLVAIVSRGVVAAIEPPRRADRTPQSGWTPLPVPGTWDATATGALKARLRKYDGFAWYRCAVTIPRSWKGKTLQLHVEKIDDAHEAYFNGVKIGSAGTFPPKHTSGLSHSSRYAVPAKIVRPGGNNVVAIRLYDHDGRAGFKGAAPTLIAGKQAIALNGVWEFRTGDDVRWAKGPAKLNNAGIYWRVMPTAVALRNAAGQGRLDPKTALTKFTVPDDLVIEQVLAEPIVRQPVFMNFDERGRLWVAQYLQYPYPAGLKMVSKDKHWRAVYDKVPPPPPNHFRGADKITIHEDTNGDGLFDKHKTFVDGLNIATSFVRGRGGVWVLNPPYLLFYPDRNNDDKPDGPPVVHLKGFGMEDTHSVVNSLRWGPDGWLYAAQGSTVSGNVQVVGKRSPGFQKSRGSGPRASETVRSMGQLIWRYHPETKRYEIFAEGGGNAFGVEIDAKGRIYSGHNGGNTRGFHYVQGGYYRKGFSKHGPLSNPYAFGYFPHMKHHNVPRFTHNFVIYESVGLPKKYRGRLFGVEPLQGQVVQAEISVDGSTYKTKDINRVIKSSDRWFRPVDIKSGPDGAIYVADLYEPQISHREHFSGQVDKTTGRIYRLRSKRGLPVLRFRSLRKASTEDLIGALSHTDKWTRQTALRLLGDRKDPSQNDFLKKQIPLSDGQTALEYLWALNLCGGFDEDFAAKTLTHKDPYVRLWTVRLLCDDRKVSPKIAARLAKLAAGESYVQVRSQLACSARRLPAAQGLPIVRRLLAHSEDVSDPHLPLLLWWAIEAKAGSHADALLALFQDKSVWSLPIVRRHILERLMRRFAQAGTRKDLLTCAKLFALSPGKSHSAALMKGFEAAFRGRLLAGLPVELSRELSKAGGGSLTFRVRQKDKAAIETALQTVATAKAPMSKRIPYAQVFGEVNDPQAVTVLLAALDIKPNDELRMTILTALQSYKDAAIAQAVIKRYGTFSTDVQAVAQTLLVSRTRWNRAFLTAIDAGKVDKASVPLDVVRKMTLHRDKTVQSLVRKHWKNVRGATTAEMAQRIARLRDVLANGTADPYKGKLLFTKSCAKCHILFGQGGRIGPDLTSYKRDDTTRILLNVVNPSAEIRKGFETYLVLTEDGRTVTGFLFDSDNRVVVLRGSDGRNITIPRKNLDEMIRQKKSLMPERLLKTLTDQQVRDLFAYLRSSQPLNN